MHIYTQIVIMKLFILALILIFPALHHIKDLYEIMKRLIQKIFKTSLIQ